MSDTKVLVLDDDRAFAVSFSESINNASSDQVVAEVVDLENFSESLTQMRKSGRNLMDDLGDYSTAVVDQDLRAMTDIFSGRTTGTDIAYLLRMHTTIDYIILLNTTPMRDIDLAWNPHFESVADLHLTGKSVGSSVLWGGSRSEALKPWYWPSIPDVMLSTQNCAEEISASLGQPLVEFLDLVDDYYLLPSEVLDQLTTGTPGSASSLQLPEATVGDFVRDHGRFGFDSKEELAQDQLYRAAAARLIKWLRFAVWPVQSVISDAPHITLRRPVLLNDHRLIGDITSWNALCADDSGVRGGDGALISAMELEKFTYKRSDWLGIPLFHWQSVNDFDDLSFRNSDFDHVPEFRFCDDVSMFLPDACTRSYRFSGRSPIGTRYVVDPSQLAEGGCKKLLSDSTQSLLDAEYEPKDLLVS